MKDTSERILNAMQEMAFYKGFHAVTIEELAAAAGVSKRTLYHYFSSKDAVVEGVVDRLLNTIDLKVQAIVQSEVCSVEKLRGIALVVADTFRSMEPGLFKDMYRYYPHLWEKIDRFRIERVERLRQVYEEGLANGVFRPMNSDILLTAFLASARAVINPDFLQNHPVSLTETFETLLGIFLNGITAGNKD